MISLFVIPSLYSNVMILTNQLKFSVEACVEVLVLSQVFMSSDTKVFEIFNSVHRAILI